MAQKIEKIFDVSKKTVLVTGASGFLGAEIAHLFALNGAQTILLGRSERVLSAAQEIQKKTQSKRVHSCRVDFYNRKEFEETIRRVTKEFSVDVLINNAYDMGPETGFNTDKGRLENLGFETWQKAFESGLYWAFYLSQTVGETMKERGGGIINVSSIYGVVSPDPELYAETPFYNPLPYGVMKAGLIAMTRYLASFWARHNIRCNAVSPGPFSNTETGSANAVRPGDPFLDRVRNKTALKRTGRPEELDGIFLLLASDAGSYITGQNFLVDGGWTIT